MIIGISKGRVQEIFFNCGYDNNIFSRGDIQYTRNLICNVGFDSYCLLKSEDIIPCLIKGCIDVGVLGSDVIDEASNNDIVEIYNLYQMQCYFALCAFPETKINNISLVATKYPNIAARIRDKLGLNFDIIKMNGSVEIAPNISYADAIIDIVQTGRTLLQNDLEVKETFSNINIKFITTKERAYDSEINRYVRKYR